MNVRRAAAIVLAAALLPAAPAAAQGSDPNPGAITVSGGYDVANAYYFRGIPQEDGDFGSVMWPYVDLGFALYSGEGAIRGLSVNVGTWNSLHTGLTGLDSPVGKLWYESDFYTTLGLGFGGGTMLGVTYTAYTSPNNSFTTVKELAFKLGFDDSALLGAAALRPYVLVAREFGREEGEVALGIGQADAGLGLGTYLEVGAAPGFGASRFSLAVPVKVGLSLADYYEGGADPDERFGFFSLAGVVTVPFTAASSRFGTWNAHGGVEYLRLGDRNAGFAGGENQVVGSLGIGFSY